MIPYLLISGSWVRVPDGAPEKAATNVAAFLLHHSLWDGLALRASARVRLAGTGR